ncbi:GNAT family N-acetyltransferase [Cellulomonas aerilata]|uniref:N-acetyltransferase domain-containing protein n=1 Tax=Cellulomonas aerilata TaxID=515326 RepID=A0A512D9U6_9CELL|nr:hypothetical protein [Cellulomonas aerilata]GEO33246.1 hypothetical protein CAE01nite_09710 [Cellulomonas aerilata]
MPDVAPWVPAGWRAPDRLDVPTGHHLRPVRASDADLDLCAVTGSQERLWSVLGAARGWPRAGLTVEQERRDLRRHERDAARGVSFAYALLDRGETEVLGHVHLERARGSGADGDVWWWVVDPLVGGPVEAALGEAVPRWVALRWPLSRPRFVGRDLSWSQWSALPDDPGVGLPGRPSASAVPAATGPGPGLSVR